jgi:two-component system chemotaxis response regulator CheB
MASPNIRVLVVDDSAVIRQVLGDAIGSTSGMEVAGTAFDGPRALEMLETVRPDVVTLDIQMPNLDGLATLDALLAKRPVPVIMVSALTQLGASITLDALERGAMDYVAKPERGSAVETAFKDDLVRKIRTVAGIDVRRILQLRQERKKRLQERSAQAETAEPAQGSEGEGSSPTAVELADKCIAIGISTGGPPALAQLFEALGPPMPPIVVVQHMPPQFTKPLAWRLNSLSALSIKEAAQGDVLRPNHVLVAPGGAHLELRRQGKWAKVALGDGPPVSGHKPSVDVMMESAAKVYGARLIGVIMTGMGRDGANGCRAIRSAGGYVFGQDEASSDVYGMNKVAFVEGHVDRQFSLGEAAAVIQHQVLSKAPTRPGRAAPDRGGRGGSPRSGSC